MTIGLNKKYQYGMATLYTTMGVGTMLFPSLIVKQFMTRGGDEFTLRCFGSQAAMVGLLCFYGKFKQYTFKAFGCAMIPYLIFDVVAYHAGYLTLPGALLDGIGNLVFAGCCLGGYYALETKLKLKALKKAEKHQKLKDEKKSI